MFSSKIYIYRKKLTKPLSKNAVFGHDQLFFAEDGI